MKTMQNIIGMILALLVAVEVQAQKGFTEQVRATFSDPSRPGKLRVRAYHGSIEVIGHDAKDVIVETHDRTLKRINGKQKRTKNGMRRLASSSGGLEIVEEDNLMKISMQGSLQRMDFVIKVPTNTSLDLKSLGDGIVRAENIRGEIEAQNMKGSVTLEKISGVVLANTMSGDVKVSFDQVQPNQPMSFCTIAGNVDVTFPATTKANLKLKAHNGEILTDFDVKLEKRTLKDEKDDRKEGGRYKLLLERVLYGSINGGGPEMSFTTQSGNIYIRKAK